MEHSPAETDWSQLSRFIADTLGLHFPRERWADLQRGLAGAADEFKFNDIASYVGWLLSAAPTREHLQMLASHLTISETYFFREKKTFEALANHILPALIQSRRGCGQRLRLWSAGCCTGEEAYSLAILVHQVLPDLANWQVTILATDINPRFIARAEAGSYGEWSFRSVPKGFTERYFTRSKEGRYAVVPQIKSMVSFALLNLVENAYPSLVKGANAMDLIFCRNVLMYFTQEQAAKVIENLRRSLVDGGCLAVSPSEASQALFSQFAAQNFPGTILYRKSNSRISDERASACPPDETIESSATAGVIPPASPPKLSYKPDPFPTLLPEMPAPVEIQMEPHAAAETLYRQGRYPEAAASLLAFGAESIDKPAAISLMARSLANQGRLSEALKWCDKWIAADKLDSAGHYFRSTVLLEHGDRTQAKQSLQRAVYLDPSFVLAHFALGNLARGDGNSADADRHFEYVRKLLACHQTDDPIPESDGITAGRLAETLKTLIAPVRMR